jgi:adenylate cyclase
MISRKRLKSRLWGGVGGALLAMVVGWILLHPVGDALTRLSYDLPFLFRNDAPEELVMVQFDMTMMTKLGLAPNGLPSRRHHAQLVERVMRDGARIVVFDVVFDGDSAEPGVDDALARAMAAHPPVVLAGMNELAPQLGAAFTRTVLPPQKLVSAASAWGLAQLSRPDPDLGLRRIDAGDTDLPSLGWAAAQVLGAPVTREPQRRLEERWFNHYGPPNWIRSVNLDHALRDSPDEGLTNGFFKDKIVVVGARPGVGKPGDEREEWPNPWSRFGVRFTSGPEWQALSLINLVRGDWLRRVSHRSEVVAVVAWGLFIGAGLTLLRPWNAAWVALLLAGGVAFGSIYVQLKFRWWGPWLIPVAAQTSVALLWSLFFQYIVETLKKRQLLRAFAGYLSPYMARRIAESEFSLELGGKIETATVMFTDLEGFSDMSEELKDPKKVSDTLIAYFNGTTTSILREDGTIIKYMGDAVMATWGAPLPDPRHAERAVIAAVEMVEAGKKPFEGRYLRTRVGINTGEILAGNLGSKFRFDYSCIGDVTNFAARLEGLNKYFGTDILVGDATKDRLGDKFRLRPLGKVRVKGKKEGIGINEVLGLARDVPADSPWLAEFQRGFDAYQEGNLDVARMFFLETIKLRASGGLTSGGVGEFKGVRWRVELERGLAAYAEGDLDAAQRHFSNAVRPPSGADGPSVFYLHEIDKARSDPERWQQWDPTIMFTSK